jgi:oxidase EvaA
MNLANSGRELEGFLEGVIEASSFQIDEINLNDQDDWKIQNGALSHKSGGFFDVIGIEDSEGNEHLLLYQPQSALTGLAICVVEDEIFVLLQARIEPGNTNVGQYGPTIQSTPANFLALHGGRPTGELDLFYGFNPRANPISSSMQLDLGKRYFQKSKWHNYVLVDEMTPTGKHMIWASLTAIREVIDWDNFLNADLRSLLVCINWSRILPQVPLEMGRTEQEALRYLLTKRSQHSAISTIRNLETLNNWSITQSGVLAHKEHDTNVKMYHTSCGTREVASWNQPLVYSQSKGLVELFLRKKEGSLECLLTIENEIGIDNGYVITASSVKYPGEVLGVAPSIPKARLLLEFIQSDEGGRFYMHESLYRIYLVDDFAPNTEGSFWVPIEELKGILTSSNLASFQLRCISSALLFRMHLTNASNPELRFSVAK